MKKTFGTIAMYAAVLCAPALGRAQDDAQWAEQWGAEQGSEATPSEGPTYQPPAPPAEMPPAPPQASSAAVPPGQWIYTQQYGWIWMPYADAYTRVPANGYGEPYAYAYYPAYGWSWLAAPWVWGLGAWPVFGVYGPARFAWYGHGWWRSPARWHYAPAHAGFAFGGGHRGSASWGGATAVPHRGGFGSYRGVAPARPGAGGAGFVPHGRAGGFAPSRGVAFGNRSPGMVSSRGHGGGGHGGGGRGFGSHGGSGGGGHGHR